MMILIALLGLACQPTYATYSSGCRFTEVELGPDDTLGELLTPVRQIEYVVLGERRFSGTYADGEVTEGTLTVTRTDEPVIGIEATPFSKRHGPADADIHQTVDIGVYCYDRVEIPVQVDFRTDDGLMDFSVTDVVYFDEGYGWAEGKRGVPEGFFFYGAPAEDQIRSLPDYPFPMLPPRLQTYWEIDGLTHVFLSQEMEDGDWLDLFDATPLP